MKYCVQCGIQLVDQAVVCPRCGCAQKVVNPEDSGGFGWGFLGFCLPLVGLILYAIWIDRAPLRAKSVGKGALIGVLLPIIAGVIAILLFFISSIVATMFVVGPM